MSFLHNNYFSHEQLSLKDFSYQLPEELIAQSPLEARDQSRLLVWKDGHSHHSKVKELSKWIPEKSLIVVNNSKVFPSRVRFKLPTGASGEALLLEPEAHSFHELDATGKSEIWLALLRPLKKLREGQIIEIAPDLSFEVLSIPEFTESGAPSVRIKISSQKLSILDWLYANGEMPLPPYIDRKHASTDQKNSDRVRYQTVYAQPVGSVAAPTAGLHLTDAIFADLKAKGCSIESVTLHVGAGTFLPVKASEISSHFMHTEHFYVPAKTIDAISTAKHSGNPVIVVGTTALRALEGLANISRSTNGSISDLANQWHSTNIFIYPKNASDQFRPWACDALMTNFHQPESTLLMLVSTLVGYDSAQKIYKDAIDQKYRFFSYGDSSLLWL